MFWCLWGLNDMPFKFRVPVCNFSWMFLWKGWDKFNYITLWLRVGWHWVLLLLPCLCWSLDYSDTMVLCVCWGLEWTHPCRLTLMHQNLQISTYLNSICWPVFVEYVHLGQFMKSQRTCGESLVKSYQVDFKRKLVNAGMIIESKGQHFIWIHTEAI